MFDADSFLSAPVEGAFDTTFTPVPVGEWPAVISKVKARASGDYTIMDVTWEIDDEGVRTETGMEKPTVRQSIFLDVTGNGGLDMGKGKNVQLGRLREALNQNGPGPWAPSMLEGQVAKVNVVHDMYEGRPIANVKSVAKM